MGWKEKRKRILLSEVGVIIAITIIILIGVVCDCLVKRGIVFHYVVDLNDASLTLLQIQAALTTLTLTIIALLSGNISDSYMGVSISDFYLERRPYFFKQKLIIVIEFVALGVSIWGHLFCLYNIVIAVFMSSMMLVLISIMEIYAIFKGKRKTLQDIESYVSFLFEDEFLCKTAGEDFIKDWKNVAPTQSKEKFEHYFQLFSELAKRILSNGSQIEILNSMSESMALFLLEHEAKGCRVKGVRFVDEIYDVIWSWITNNKEQATKIKTKISIIDRIPHEWYCAMDSLDAEMFEENVNFDHFSETIIRVASWIGDAKEKSNNELSAINSIARTLGGYVDKQSKQGRILTNKYWENQLSNRFWYSAYGIPDASVDMYHKAMALRDFSVCYGYLLSGRTDLVLNGFFLDCLNN